jgi:hypothetical protein
MRRWLTAAVTLALVFSATACSNNDDDSKGMGDAPVATASTGKKGGDDSPATITNMPDGYINLATKCVAGAPPWRAIVGTHTDYASSPLGLVQDPKACGGDWVPGPKVVLSPVTSGAPPQNDDS